MNFWREEYFAKCTTAIKEQKDPVLEKYLGGLWEWIAQPLDDDDQSVIDTQTASCHPTLYRAKVNLYPYTHMAKTTPTGNRLGYNPHTSARGVDMASSFKSHRAAQSRRAL
jgi:hypothetical protein